MSTSRRQMREASRSLAIAFNIGQAQEALYRVDAGESLDDESKLLFMDLARFFHEAVRGLDWSQETIDESGDDDSASSDGGALRALGLVLPVVRRRSNMAPRETLALLSEVSEKLGAGELVQDDPRSTFDAVLDDLGRYAAGKSDRALDQRGTSASLLPVPE